MDRSCRWNRKNIPLLRSCRRRRDLRRNSRWPRFDWNSRWYRCQIIRDQFVVRKPFFPFKMSAMKWRPYTDDKVVTAYFDIFPNLLAALNRPFFVFDS
jgi:hypothetical protein